MSGRCVANSHHACQGRHAESSGSTVILVDRGPKKQKQTISSRQIDESVPISDFFPPNYPPCSSITTSSSVICPLGPQSIVHDAASRQRRPPPALDPHSATIFILEL